jgi:hypothetical protein
MVSDENKEIKVTASDALEFEPVLHESSSGGWGWKIFLSLILVGGGTGAWVLYGDTLMERLSGGDGSVPLIKAAAGPIKVRPENPGGLKVPNRDKLVYDRMQKTSGGGERGPERLLPPPEQPIEKPKFTAKKPSRSAAPAAKKTPAKPEKLIAAKKTPPKPVKTNPMAKVPSIKDVNTAKRPMPPPPPQAPPSAVRTPSSGSSFGEPAKAPPKAAPVKKKTAPVRKVTKEPAKVAAKRASSQATTQPSTPAAPISRDRAYLVQLAAARSSQGAREEWQRLRAKHLDLLGRLGLTITKVDLGAGKGIFYRLRAGPLADEGQARSLCRILASRKVGCLVIKPMK